MPQKTNFEIRLLLPPDFAQAAQIERQSFTEPWQVISFLSESANPHALMLAAQAPNGSVVGWGGMQWCLDEGSVTNIAVLPEFRGQGAGRLLTEGLIAAAKQRQLTTLTLEVRKSNLVAQGLYHSLGFEALGLRPKFYRLPDEDAVMMRLNLQG